MDTNNIQAPQTNVPPPQPNVPEQTPVQPQPSVTTSSPSPQQVSPENKNLFKWLLIFLVLLIVTSLAAYLFVSPKNESKTSQVLPTPTPLPTVALAKEGDPTADWKTYTDEMLKFSIKYPNTIVVSDLPEATIPGITATFLLENEAVKAKERLKKDPNSKDLGITIQLGIVKRGQGGNPLNAFINSECPKPCNENTENVSINNAAGIRTLGPHYPQKDNYYLANRDKTVVLRVYILRDPNKFQDNSPEVEEFRKMINTFTFTDQSQAVDTSNWKTYVNPLGQYSFKHPKDWTISYNSVNSSLAPFTAGQTELLFLGPRSQEKQPGVLRDGIGADFIDLRPVTSRRTIEEEVIYLAKGFADPYYKENIEELKIAGKRAFQTKVYVDPDSKEGGYQYLIRLTQNLIVRACRELLDSA